MARVLFLGEAVTLAPVARCLVLGEALMREHEVAFAFAGHAHRYLPPKDYRVASLASISPARFAEALWRGRPIYDEATLVRYVEEDLRLIDAFGPDLVVGDFRISLSVSARLRSLPSLGIANAFWSPWYERPPPLPALAWTKWTPLPLARAIFGRFRRPVMAAHADPLNRVRRRYRLPELPCNLPHVYTDTDYVAYADVPELFPTPGLPATHRYIGPILWSPHVPMPPWCTQGRSVPTAFVAMGGPSASLRSVVDALDAMGIEGWIDAAGSRFESSPGSLARSAPCLRGAEAARHADLVICNGDSLATQQALAAGKAILGITSTMDQFLNMRPIAEAGAGIALRADRVSVHAVTEAIEQLRSRPGFARQAGRLSNVFARYTATDAFRSIVRGIISAPGISTEHSRLRAGEVAPDAASAPAGRPRDACSRVEKSYTGRADEFALEENLF